MTLMLTPACISGVNCDFDNVPLIVALVVVPLTSSAVALAKHHLPAARLARHTENVVPSTTDATNTTPINGSSEQSSSARHMQRRVRQ